jgi:hypothetical protein
VTNRISVAFNDDKFASNGAIFCICREFISAFGYFGTFGQLLAAQQAISIPALPCLM